MLTIDPIVPAADAVDALKTYLRIEQDDEDAALAALAASAISHSENYLGQVLIERDVVERLPVSDRWQRLGASPVRTIAGVTGSLETGASFTLASDAFAVDIDSNGDGWVRITTPGAAVRTDVAYRAGLRTVWEDLPEALLLGILRLAGHLHANRDRSDDTGPPAAVAALLRPWRRMRLA